ncbi:hypothetical protein V8G54_005304 [Vigna mungo]|uniref:RING-type domain-containing protein n=1 Tax=Vigna mungo TaxID=3915 RepID=A0AAQ3NZU9_VIGMU
MIKVSVLKPLVELYIHFVAKDDAFLRVGVTAIVVYLILKILGVYDDAEQHSQVTIDVTYRTNNLVATHAETEPLMRVEENRMSYGTNAKDDKQNSGAYSSSSSEELYDEKLCCICYDEQRNSFFVPCGHCATCYDCAQRYSLLNIFSLYKFQKIHI